MIFRAPMTVDLLGVRRGAPVSALYTYLIGTLPENHMGVKAQSAERGKDATGGRFHGDAQGGHARARAEMVTLDRGGSKRPRFVGEHRGHIQRQWEIRTAVDFGDVRIRLRRRRWASSFRCTTISCCTRGYMPPRDARFPVVLHYGLTFNVLDYAFSKHWYHGFTLGCPDQELFQRPPDPSALRTRGMLRRRDEITLHCAWGLYNATRGYAMERCGVKDPRDPPKKSYACRKDSLGVLTCEERRGDDTFRGEESTCQDTNEACCDWASKGECDRNPTFMSGELSPVVRSVPGRAMSVQVLSSGCVRERRPSRPAAIPVRDAVEERPTVEKPIEDARVETARREEQTPKEVREGTRDIEEDNEDVGGYSSWRWPGVVLVSLVLLLGVARVRAAMRRRDRRRARPRFFYRVKQ